MAQHRIEYLEFDIDIDIIKSELHSAKMELLKFENYTQKP